MRELHEHEHDERSAEHRELSSDNFVNSRVTLLRHRDDCRSALAGGHRPPSSGWHAGPVPRHGKIPLPL